MGEQSGHCFLPSVEQNKAAFHFPRHALWIYSLREELLNLKRNPIPFCVNAPNQHVAVCPCECGPVKTDTNMHPHAVPFCIWLYIRGDSLSYFNFMIVKLPIVGFLAALAHLL